MKFPTIGTPSNNNVANNSSLSSQDEMSNLFSDMFMAMLAQPFVPTQQSPQAPVEQAQLSNPDQESQATQSIELPTITLKPTEWALSFNNISASNTLQIRNGADPLDPGSDIALISQDNQVNDDAYTVPSSKDMLTMQDDMLLVKNNFLLEKNAPMTSSITHLFEGNPLTTLKRQPSNIPPANEKGLPLDVLQSINQSGYSRPKQGSELNDDQLDRSISVTQTQTSPQSPQPGNTDEAAAVFRSGLQKIAGAAQEHMATLPFTYIQGESRHNATQDIISTRTPQSTSISSYIQDDLPIHVDTMSVAPSSQGYHATIKLYPPELGELTAKLHVGLRHTQLVLQTQNERTKEIVETYLPILKAHFEKNDLTVTHVEVVVNQGANHFSDDKANANNKSFMANQDDRDNNLSQTKPKTTNQATERPDSLVDTYA